METRTILYADNGKVLTNGTVYGRVIYLAEGESEADYKEITEKAYAKIVAEEEKKLEQEI